MMALRHPNYGGTDTACVPDPQHDEQDAIMSKAVATGPDAQGKFSLEINIGGLTGAIAGFSSKMEAEDYATSLLRRVKELAKADGLK
ncbi:hypothetical protein CFR77_04165 [Komagataeibacter sucrofermentans]|uniref:Uncharacterized protein n=2 Tax=Komagataeibacter sucrofermentans TaxID=1053551 RepID=A0A318QS47_9PROT|nr:hypothetical protein CFR77_04165 [Komagataeibacter sucrofermentans]